MRKDVDNRNNMITNPIKVVDNIITNLHVGKRPLPPSAFKQRVKEVDISISHRKPLDSTLLPQKNLLLLENSMQISQSIRLNPKMVIRETLNCYPLLNTITLSWPL